MTPGRFRLLLVVHLLSGLVNLLLVVRDEGLTPGLVEAYEAATPAWIENDIEMILSLSALVAVIAVVCYVGLWSFRRWARALMLWLTPVGLLLYPFLGPTVIGPWSSAFYDASMLSFGALLAFAYSSPVRERFEVRSPQSSSPNP